MAAPKGNQNARTHGAYTKRAGADAKITAEDQPNNPLIIKSPTIAETIRALVAMNEQILKWLAQNRDATPAQVVLNAYRLMADNTARLARILQKQEAQPDPALQWFEEALERVQEETTLAINNCTEGERHTT